MALQSNTIFKALRQDVFTKWILFYKNFIWNPFVMKCLWKKYWSFQFHTSATLSINKVYPYRKKHFKHFFYTSSKRMRLENANIYWFLRNEFTKNKHEIMKSIWSIARAKIAWVFGDDCFTWKSLSPVPLWTCTLSLCIKSFKSFTFIT